MDCILKSIQLKSELRISNTLLLVRSYYIITVLYEGHALTVPDFSQHLFFLLVCILMSQSVWGTKFSASTAADFNPLLSVPP